MKLVVTYYDQILLGAACLLLPTRSSFLVSRYTTVIPPLWPDGTSTLLCLAWTGKPKITCMMAKKNIYKISSCMIIEAFLWWISCTVATEARVTTCGQLAVVHHHLLGPCCALDNWWLWRIWGHCSRRNWSEIDALLHCWNDMHGRSYHIPYFCIFGHNGDEKRRELKSLWDI